MSGPDAMPVLTHDEVVEMSGAFVLGALPPAEAVAVRRHLGTCQLDHTEIAELGSVLPVLAASAPVAVPPDGLRARIMAAATAEAATQTSAAATAEAATAVPTPAAPVVAVASAPTPSPIAPQRAARRTGRIGAAGWALRAAAVVAIVALGGWNLLLRNQLAAAQSYQQAVASVIDVAGQAGSLTAVLTADGGPGTGLAAISASGRMTLAMQDLAPTSGSTVYTAWVIGGDGVPADIGSFTVDGAGTASLSAGGLPTTSGIVLAVTREPEAGLSAPTGPVISKGKATAAG